MILPFGNKFSSRSLLCTSLLKHIYIYIYVSEPLQEEKVKGHQFFLWGNLVFFKIGPPWQRGGCAEEEEESEGGEGQRRRKVRREGGLHR